MINRQLLVLLMAAVLGLAAVVPCRAQGATPSVAFEQSAVRVEGGQAAEVVLVASAPFDRDVVLRVREGKAGERLLTLPAGDTRVGFAVEAPLAAKGSSVDYLLLSSADYTRAKPYECRVTRLSAAMYAFRADVFAAYAGDELTVRLSVANPGKLAAGARVELRDASGNILAEFAHSQRREGVSITLETDESWRPGKGASVWVEGRAAADDTALLAVGKQSVKSIYGVRRGDNKIAFTMDCGSGSGNVPEVLDLLDEYGLRITFFVTGQFANNNREYLAEMAARGHEIGNHSWSHPSFTDLSGDDMLRQLERTNAVIYEVTGQRAALFRPPKGDCNARVRTVVNAAGFHVIRWTHECYDSRDGASSEKSLRYATKDITGGSIILSHVNADCTVAVLPDILSWYRDNGFEVVKVSELLPEGATAVDENGLIYAVDR